MTDEITIAPLDTADIEDVGPLWKALMDHVAALPDALVPVRPSEESWVLERAVMLDALADDAFVLVARRSDEPVGYALRDDRRARPGLVHRRLARGTGASRGRGGRARQRRRLPAPRRGGRRARAARRRRRGDRRRHRQRRRGAALRAPRLPRRLSRLLWLARAQAVGLSAARSGRPQGRARPLRAAPGRLRTHRRHQVSGRRPPEADTE